MRHLLEVDDLTPAEVEHVLDLAGSPRPPQVLAGRGAALLFQKPSTRTRSSMELAVVQLGGHPVTIRPDEVGLDHREPVEDVGRTLACYHAVVAARVYDHGLLERLAALGAVPVVNMLSDDAHPLQALADLLTLRAEWGELAGRTLAYVGDANNMARSLAIACGLLGVGFRIAHPPGYGFGAAALERIAASGADVLVTEHPAEAVAGADAVYTDVWASMGQEEEAAQRRHDFAGFTVTSQLLDGAAPGAVFLHCLPAHRGEEVAAEVIDGPRSRVWAQAENRMHAARGALAWLLGDR